MTKVLVTGAAGFIGSHFCQHLLETTDWDVVGLDSTEMHLNTHTSSFQNNQRFHFVPGDLNSEILLEVVEHCDAVVHLAAETHNDFSISDPMAFFESNTRGTFSVLEAVRKFDKRLHYVSTDEVFGDLKADEPSFTEFSRYRPSSPYSSSKAAADMLVMGWTRTYKIDITTSNSSNNYGPGQSVEKFIPRMVTRAILGDHLPVYGSGKNIRDWIHVQDHVGALKQILDKGLSGETYLIGCENEKTNLDIVGLIIEAAGMDESAIRMTADRPGHDFRYSIDSTKLREEIGWQPKDRDFRNDIFALFDWYKQNEAWWKPMKKSVDARYGTQ